MARGKTVQTNYKRVKDRKGRTKLVKTGKTVIKSSNVMKGMGGGTQPWTSDAAALKSKKIDQEASVRKAAIAGRSANIAQLTAAASSIANNAIKGRNSTTNTAVDQSVLGGLQQGARSRDEDTEDNPYID